MKTFQTSITISAPPARIWGLLTDAGGYPNWNSTVNRIDGPIEHGARITVHARVPSERAFPLTVSSFQPTRSMVWSSGMPLGLFTGQRTFSLSGTADGRTQFEMKEQFSGLLAPLIGRAIPDLQPAFDKFAADLKAAAERA